MRDSAPNGDIQEVHATIIALNGVEPLLAPGILRLTGVFRSSLTIEVARMIALVRQPILSEAYDSSQTFSGAFAG